VYWVNWGPAAGGGHRTLFRGGEDHYVLADSRGSSRLGFYGNRNKAGFRPVTPEVDGWVGGWMVGG
jgi:hypothetical protein